MTFTVSELPDLRLTKNGRRRLGYYEQARLTRAENVRWYFLLLPLVQLSRSNLPLLRVTLSWELTFPTRRIPDDDGTMMALAPIRDLLCVANRRERHLRYYLGVVVDDDPAHIVSTTLAQGYERGVSQTRITLEEVP